MAAVEVMGRVVERLRRAVLRRDAAELSDGQLLDGFIERRDESAFEGLVQRHGRMVLGVCRRILRQPQDAEDAFQATFLVLVRKATSIRPREMVGNWLYGVAYQTAIKARALAAKRYTRERQVADMPEPKVAEEDRWNDLQPLLDQELSRLPDKYRVPIVLCDLEGKGHKEAAEQLGWPQGTVSGRLSRGRVMLAKRLNRRGLGFSAGALAALVCAKGASACVPPSLAAATLKTAGLVAAGQTAAGVSANIVALTDSVLKVMLLNKLKLAATGLFALVLSLGVGTVAYQALADGPAAEEQLAAQGDGHSAIREAAPRNADQRDATQPDADQRDADQRGATQHAATERDGERGGAIVRGDQENVVRGYVVAVANDGKTITLETPARGRGEEPKKTDVQIDDKTIVTYHGVAPNGANPTKGYLADVRLREGTETAIRVKFGGSERFRRSYEYDLAGRVCAVARDGKGITVELAGPRGRDEQPRKVAIQFNDRTQMIFSAVAEGGANLAEGLNAHVMLLDGVRGDVAAIVNLFGKEQIVQRSDPAPDISGQIVAVVRDGKTIALEVAVPPGRDGARNQDTKKLDVKLGDKTAIVFNDVLAGGTKIAKGQSAQVWLEANSKDSAAKLIVTGVVPERWTTVEGKVVTISRDGATITLEQPAKQRGDQPGRLDVKITPRTRIGFFNIGPDEATLTEGYHAEVRLTDGSTDTAAQVMLSKRDARPR